MVLCLVVPLCAAALSACNTVEGFAKDMRQLSQQISRMLAEPSSPAGTRRRSAVSGPAGTAPAESETPRRSRPGEPQAVNREATDPEAEDPEAEDPEEELDRMYKEQLERHAL
ncbi:MAG: hypothetical protein L0191_10730 [Acidobacteria bacterium]|nr:hypothetical protein [Acidobacteriota bacterium]